jgi:hypothetical protein
MRIRKQILAGAVASSMIGLAACGGGKGTQDVGSNASGSSSGSSSRTFHARAIDGYLAGASVFVDLNENGKLDAFEPRALTDNDGYFSYNHSTGTDYCAAGGLSQYCLRGAIDANAEVLIRVTGGYDTITHLPFEGMLSLRSSDLKRDDLRLVTPQTSMLADSSQSAQAKFDALVAAGLLSDSLDEDQFSEGNAAGMSRAQLAAIISRLTADVIEDAKPQNSFNDVDSKAWAASYIAMAKTMEGRSASFEEIFASPIVLEDVIRRTLYSVTNPGQTMPEDFQAPNPALRQNLLQLAAELIELNGEMLAGLSGTATSDELKAILRLQMIAAERALQNPQDAQLSNIFEWVRLQLAQANGLGSDLTALGGDDIDLNALISPSFVFDPNSNTISASAKVPAEAATAFASLVNTSFSVSVDKPDEQGDAVLFISGANGARSGDIKVCVRYRGDDGDFDTTSSTDPNGALLVGGHWSLLDDHTLTLGLEVAGGMRSMLLKAVNTNASGLDYRFDFGDDLSQWSGEAPAGFAAGSVPTSDAACKASLIDRFGPLT